jgi:hypothetical protein
MSSRPWLLPIAFGVALALLCGMGYWLRAGIRTRKLAQCWRCGASKVRPSKARSSDMLAAMFLLRPYRCGGCLTRFYGFRSFGPGVPVFTPMPAAIPLAAPIPAVPASVSASGRRSLFRIRVKVIIRLPLPTDWKSAREFLLAEEQGFLAKSPAHPSDQRISN